MNAVGNESPATEPDPPTHGTGDGPDPSEPASGGGPEPVTGDGGGPGPVAGDGGPGPGRGGDGPVRHPVGDTPGPVSDGDQEQATGGGSEPEHGGGGPMRRVAGVTGGGSESTGGDEAAPVRATRMAVTVEGLRHRALDLAADCADAQADANTYAGIAYRRVDMHSAAVHSVTAHHLAQTLHALRSAFDHLGDALTASTQANTDPPEPEAGSGPKPVIAADIDELGGV